MSIYFCLIFIISIFTTNDMVSKKKKQVALLTQREQNIFTKTNQLVFGHVNHKNTQTTNK
ncbi:hypothetical protein ACE6H2_007900 [Prunus campanulata]